MEDVHELTEQKNHPFNLETNHSLNTLIFSSEYIPNKGFPESNQTLIRFS